MNPFTIGDNALGALESLTGGHAGPSSANSSTSQDFWGGGVTIGSAPQSNTVIWIALIALVIAGVWYAAKKG